MPKSDDDLKMMSHHIGYSILMLRECVSNVEQVVPVRDEFSLQYQVPKYSTAMVVTSESIVERVTISPATRMKRVKNNMAIEAFLLHYRRLLDVFYSKGKYPDDCVATDFVRSEIDWPATRAVIPESLSNLYAPLNKHLAHLTYDPVWKGKQEWPLGEMSELIEDVYAGFLASLDSTRKSWFPDGSRTA